MKKWQIVKVRTQSWPKPELEIVVKSYSKQIDEVHRGERMDAWRRG